MVEAVTSMQVRPLPTVTGVRAVAAKPVGAVTAVRARFETAQAFQQTNRNGVQFAAGCVVPLVALITYASHFAVVPLVALLPVVAVLAAVFGAGANTIERVDYVTGVVCAVFGVILGSLFLFLAHFAVVTLILLSLSLVMTVWAWREHHQEQAARVLIEEGWVVRWDFPLRWLGRMLLVPFALAALLGYAWAQYRLAWQVCELVSLGSACWTALVIAVMEKPVEVVESRWDEETLSAALTAAGAVKGTFTRLGTPQKDEHGEWQTLKLAPGETWTDVARNLPSLASALDVEEDMLTVEHAGGPPNTVKVRITERGPTPSAEVVVSDLVNAVQTNWRDPVHIGVDNDGKPVHLLTAEHNTLIAGVMGYGKTVSARMPLGHFLLDPVTTLYVADGKSSKRDYGAVAPSCERFVWGTDEDAPEQMLSMLKVVLNVVRDRNGNDYDGAEWPGLLLLLEEFQDIRAGAERTEREEIDKTLGRIVRMGRAVSVHVLISTQRPSVEDLPSGTRNLIDQRLALVLRNGQDASLVLGHTPPKHLPTPSRKGEAIFADPATDRAVQLDYIDGPSWKALCARAAVLRAPQVDLAKPERESITVAAPAPLTLLAAVTNALGAGEVQSEALYARLVEVLPAGLLPANSSAMGRALGKHPRFASRRTATGTRWRLVGVTADAQMTSSAPVLSVNGGQAVVVSASDGSAVGAGVRR